MMRGENELQLAPSLTFIDRTVNCSISFYTLYTVGSKRSFSSFLTNGGFKSFKTKMRIIWVFIFLIEIDRNYALPPIETKNSSALVSHRQGKCEFKESYLIFSI